MVDYICRLLFQKSQGGPGGCSGIPAGDFEECGLFLLLGVWNVHTPFLLQVAYQEGGIKMAKWYAVMCSEEKDWGIGSYCYSEAVCMATMFGHDAYIAVIEDGKDLCVEEIHDLPEARSLEGLPLNEWNDGELIAWIDEQAAFDEDSMTELIKRADLYDEESGILTRWQAEPDGQHDIQDFFDEACDIIRNFHKRMGE